jgi:hypothetical protein
VTSLKDFKRYQINLIAADKPIGISGVLQIKKPTVAKAMVGEVGKTGLPAAILKEGGLKHPMPFLLRAAGLLSLKFCLFHIV